ncbi:MAG: ubiquinol-cytochrome c reductase iron-sulfur subunit [Porticoccaceae bacterium]|nr:ubiquinol-cytochrome c reductase iron-sulfur subunit [Porticoccaceae bacterium]
MSNDGVNHDRRRFLIGGACVTGAVGGVFAAVPFVGSWAPSAKAKAAGAPVKANIGKLEPGQMMTVEWRGKPVYVVRRTDAVLESLQSTKDRVRDPNSESSKQPAYVDPFHRAINPEYLVLVGLCTHLGCAPQFQPQVGPMPFNPDWQGGFFCPCHGSMFDLAGRVFEGVPAPINLEVPPHRFEGDILVVGEDQEAA